MDSNWILDGMREHEAHVISVLLSLVHSSSNSHQQPKPMTESRDLRMFHVRNLYEFSQTHNKVFVKSILKSCPISAASFAISDLLQQFFGLSLDGMTWTKTRGREDKEIREIGIK